MLESFWVVRDAVEGAGWLERLLERAPDAEPALRAQALRALGGASTSSAMPIARRLAIARASSSSRSAGEELEAAHMRFRIAANMVMRGETETRLAAPRGVLAEARELGHPIGECQVLGFLAEKAYREGDLDRASRWRSRAPRSPHALGWTWWEVGQFGDVAEMERELGRLDDAERHAQRSLELALGLGDRRHIVFAGAVLAIIAAERGDGGRAGLIWGAVESEANAAASASGRANAPSSRRSSSPSTVPGSRTPAPRARLLSISQAAGLGPPTPAG